VPKPLLLSRRSGFYVRFLVPESLRPAIGSRFLVRPLHGMTKEAVRLAAALLDVALSQACFRPAIARRGFRRQGSMSGTWRVS